MRVRKIACEFNDYDFIIAIADVSSPVYNFPGYPSKVLHQIHITESLPNIVGIAVRTLLHRVSVLATLCVHLIHILINIISLIILSILPQISPYLRWRNEEEVPCGRCRKLCTIPHMQTCVSALKYAAQNPTPDKIVRMSTSKKGLLCSGSRYDATDIQNFNHAIGSKLNNKGLFELTIYGHRVPLCLSMPIPISIKNYKTKRLHTIPLHHHLF